MVIVHRRSVDWWSVHSPLPAKFPSRTLWITWTVPKVHFSFANRLLHSAPDPLPPSSTVLLMRFTSPSRVINHLPGNIWIFPTTFSMRQRKSRVRRSAIEESMEHTYWSGVRLTRYRSHMSLLPGFHRNGYTISSVLRQRLGNEIDFWRAAFLPARYFPVQNRRPGKRFEMSLKQHVDKEALTSNRYKTSV